MFDQFRRSIKRSIMPFVPSELYRDSGMLQMPLAPFSDLSDYGAHYVVTAELPGLTKDDAYVRLHFGRNQG